MIGKNNIIKILCQIGAQTSNNLLKNPKSKSCLVIRNILIMISLQIKIIL